MGGKKSRLQMTRNRHSPAQSQVFAAWEQWSRVGVGKKDGQRGMRILRTFVSIYFKTVSAAISAVGLRGSAADQLCRNCPTQKSPSESLQSRTT
jgi:hypothetical protein